MALRKQRRAGLEQSYPGLLEEELLFPCPAYQRVLSLLNLSMNPRGNKCPKILTLIEQLKELRAICEIHYENVPRRKTVLVDL
jgi:hypothetical protein